MEVSAVGRGYQSWRKRFFSLERERTTVLTLRRCLVSLYHLSSGIPLHPSPSSFCLPSAFIPFLLLLPLSSLGRNKWVAYRGPTQGAYAGGLRGPMGAYGGLRGPTRGLRGAYTGPMVF